MSDNAFVQLESALFQAVAGTRVAAVKNRHVVFFRQRVNRIEQAREIFFRIDVFFAVGAEEHVAPFFQAEAGVNVACFNVFQICVKDFRHRRSRNVSAFLRQAVVRQVAAGVFAVAEIDIADDIDDAAVGFFREAFVFAAVPGFHVENRDVEAFCGNGAETTVGVAENEHSVGFDCRHQLIGSCDDVPDGGAEVVADGIHVNFGIGEL